MAEWVQLQYLFAPFYISIRSTYLLPQHTFSYLSHLGSQTTVSLSLPKLLAIFQYLKLQGLLARTTMTPPHLLAQPICYIIVVYGLPCLERCTPWSFISRVNTCLLIILAVIPYKATMPTVQIIEIRGWYDNPVSRRNNLFGVFMAIVPCLQDSLDVVIIIQCLRLVSLYLKWIVILVEN